MNTTNETEYQQDFRDWVFAVVGPILIILLLGSLVFFLMDVIYQGDYPLAVHYVYGLFVVAAVLVSRISIEEGLERAQIFGILLCVAMLIKTGIGLHNIIIVVTWWSASKLVWDTTFVDNSRDVSSRGLVQLSWEFFQKLGKKKAAAVTSDAEVDTDLDQSFDEDEIYGKRSDPLWKRVIFSRKTTNTPGLWAFFFCIAALPIFGIGQLFLKNNYEMRNWCTWLFAVYIFSALGLMMVSSLIGLLRYLRSRNATMPDSIAKSWIAIGTVFVFGILFVTWLLPRPTTGISFASNKTNDSWVKGKKSLLNQQSPRATGDNKRDGQDGRGDTSSRSKQSTTEKNQRGTKGTSNEGKGDAKNKTGDQDGGKSGKGGKSNKKSAGNKSKSNSSSKSQKGGKGKQPGNQKTSSGKKPSDQANQTEKKQNDSPKDGRNSKSKDPRDSNKTKSDRKDDAGKSNSNVNKDQKKNSRSVEKDKDESQANEEKKTSASNRSSRGNPMGQKKSTQNKSQQSKNPKQQSTSNLWSIIRALFMFFFYLILILAALYFAWKYRAQIISAWKKFLQDLAAWWDKLFNKKTATANAIVENSSQPERRLASFDEFNDPFATGRAAAMKPTEIVQYTFHALEAWARQFDCDREQDQTPLEFAKQVANIHESIGEGSGKLARLYCLSAYSQADSISRKSCEPLRLFWQKLTALYRSGTAPRAIVEIE